MSHRSANKLVSYRSQTTGLTEPRGAKMSIEDESIEPYASSHTWARLDEGRDLSELQKSHKQIEYIDLAQKKNLRFHQKSENGEVYVVKDGSDSEEDLVASKYPLGVPSNHPKIRDGIRALNLYKDVHRYQVAKQLQ